MDPRICRPEKPAYRLPGSGRTFPYESVLNDRIGRAGRINPGDSTEGIVLAFRRERFPDECLAGPLISAELSIVDQYGRQHVSEIEVEVDRTAIINSLKNSLKLTSRQGLGLYDTSESQANVTVREPALRPVEAVVSSNIPDELLHPKPETYEGIPNEGS